MRRWVSDRHTSRHTEGAVASSSPPPPLNHSAPPLTDPCDRRSGCSAARAPAGNSSAPLHSLPTPTQPVTFPQRRKLTELHFNKVWELPNQTVALKETAKNNKTNYKKKEKKKQLLLRLAEAWSQYLAHFVE